jgi:hypothetical protein
MTFGCSPGSYTRLRVALAGNLPRLSAVASGPSVVENMEHPIAGTSVCEPGKVELREKVMLSWFAHLRT